MASAQTSVKFAIGWTGAIAVAFAVGAIILAAAASPSWQIDIDPLCALGVGDSALTYTIGMAIAGILIAVYGVGRAAFSRNYHAEASTLTAALGVCVTMLCFFTTDYANGDIHAYLRFAAMLFLVLAVTAQSYQYWLDGGMRRLTAGVGIIVLTVCISAMITMNLNIAINTVAICGLVWLSADAVTYIYGNLNTLKVNE